jgi:hypothetical protein
MIMKTNNVKNILSLSANQALDFFMKSQQYHGFELPEYFNFDDLLTYIKNTIADASYEECLSTNIPDNLPDVNIDIMMNKDGKYAVRPVVLANPYLYYSLAREICSTDNWHIILDRFAKYNVPHLTSSALPIIPKKKEAFHRSETIFNWWNSMEQRAIELSLEYRYMFVSDITNCYGSINPQSIDWALICKNTSYEDGTSSTLATNIQNYLCALQHGHNIGIPQGSTLFDFIGEIVLGYSDLLLHEALQRENISGYEILRYRDDYRIFCNNKDTLERISYILQSVLESLNFRMNTQKTMISESIITDSIKPDKLFYIYNTPIFNKKECDFDGIQKHLLYILQFARQFPNSGYLRTLLSDLDQRIIKKLEPKERFVKLDKLDPADLTGTIFDKVPTYTPKMCPGKLFENVRALTAIATQIAIENVTVCHYALRVISRMVDSITDMQEKQDIIQKVYNKLCNQPNSDYNQLWLQNITYTQDKKENISPYTMRLCKLVMGEDNNTLWNLEWLKDKYTQNIPLSSIVNPEILKEITPVITFRETRAYTEDY